MDNKKKFIHLLARFGYFIGCLALYGIALWIIGSALYGLMKESLKSSFSVYSLLDEVGLIVFAIATIDVVKYLAEEELLKGSDKRSERQEKRSLTKFIVIISTALALEGLVLTIETAKTQIEKLLFPVLLLAMSAFFILVLGFYLKLTKEEP